jgi:ABC-type multidrug transport system fused ATPase/permease subunit
VLVVAHRLSTVHLADVIYYIADGKVVASGNFDELRKSVNEFDQQARLMGL